MAFDAVKMCRPLKRLTPPTGRMSRTHSEVQTRKHIDDLSTKTRVLTGLEVPGELLTVFYVNKGSVKRNTENVLNLRDILYLYLGCSVAMDYDRNHMHLITCYL